MRSAVIALLGAFSFLQQRAGSVPLELRGSFFDVGAQGRALLLDRPATGFEAPATPFVDGFHAVPNARLAPLYRRVREHLVDLLLGDLSEARLPLDCEDAVCERQHTRAARRREHRQPTACRGGEVFTGALVASGFEVR